MTLRRLSACVFPTFPAFPTGTAIPLFAAPSTSSSSHGKFDFQNECQQAPPSFWYVLFFCFSLPPSHVTSFLFCKRILVHPATSSFGHLPPSPTHTHTHTGTHTHNERPPFGCATAIIYFFIFFIFFLFLNVQRSLILFGRIFANDNDNDV